VGFVSAADYERILGIVAEATRGRPEDQLPVPILEMIRSLLACDVAAYFEGPPWDRVGRRVWVTDLAVPWSTDEKQAVTQYRFQVPLYPSAKTLDRPVRISDVMSQLRYRKLDIYQLAGRPHDIEYSMDYWMTGSGGRVRGLRFDNSSADFSDRARDALEVLGRHLKVVLGRHDAVGGAEGGPTAASARALAAGLTPREAEIVALVARCQTNRQIAHTLSISPHTVRKHLENAYATLGIHSRAEAVVWAYDGRAGRPALERLGEDANGQFARGV
jgi:DNA-binding CsgD family transcriptional regulator